MSVVEQSSKSLSDEKISVGRGLSNNTVKIDREKTCPFLLRLFCKKHAHHRIEEFFGKREPLDDELQIYTWHDASFRELANLVKEVFPEIRKADVQFSFKLLARNDFGRISIHELAVIDNLQKSSRDSLSLRDTRFYIGDFIDVAIFYDKSNEAKSSRQSHNIRSR